MLVVTKSSNPMDSRLDEFLNAIEVACERNHEDPSTGDLYRWSSREALCHRRWLDDVLSRIDILDFSAKQTQQETICISENMVFSFTFDELPNVPDITSRTDRPLIPSKEQMEEESKKEREIDWRSGDRPFDLYEDLVLLGMDYDGCDDWDDYEYYVHRHTQLSYPMVDVVVQESSIDPYNVEIIPPVTKSWWGGDFSRNYENIRHINENADFFKRLLPMMPVYNEPRRLRSASKNGLDDGVQSATPITLNIFFDCDNSIKFDDEEKPQPIESKERVPGQLLRENELEGDHYVITKKGLLCKGVEEGKYFVFLGVKLESTDEIHNFGVLQYIKLAMPFGESPDSPPMFRESSPRMSSSERRRVIDFNNSVIRMGRKITVQDSVIEDMKDIGRRYESMRFLKRESMMLNPRLLLITGPNVFVLTRYSISAMFEDFPQYDETWLEDEGHVSPNPIPSHGMYYRIESATMPEDYVAVGIHNSGFIDKVKKQLCKFIKRNGQFVSIDNMDFAFPF